MSTERGWAMPWPGPELAREAEAAGVAAFCAGEFADRNAYVTMAEMAAHTSSAMVGTGVAYAFARSPFVHASAIRQLERQAPGRVFLGLGSGTRRMNQSWFAAPFDPPLKRMEEMIGAIRAFLLCESMQTVTFDGEYYPIDAAIRAPIMKPLDVPILVGAFNRGMLKVVGRAADGVMGHGLFTDRWWTEMVDPTIDEAAAAAGRDSTAIRRWGWVITSIDDDDPARADRDAKLMVAFYLTVKTYDTLTELHGWADDVARIRSAFAKGDIDGMADAVSADMLDAITIHGTTEQAIEQIARRRRLPEMRFHSPPSFMVSPKRGAAYARSIIRVLSSMNPVD